MSLITAILISSASLTALKLLQGNKIVKEAAKYIGIKEIGNNAGFSDADFEARMKSSDIGFIPGYDYCTWFVKLVLLNCLDRKKRAEIIKLMNGSSQTSFYKLLNSGFTWITFSSEAKPGDIAFYKWTDKDWRGHAEIVKEVNGNSYISISGNSTITGTGFEGITLKQRTYDLYNNTQFKLLGFIRIK